MRKSMHSLLPVMVFAAWLPAHAQGQEPARSDASIAGKAATAKAAPSNPAAKSATERKRVQVTANTAAAAAAAQPTSPVAIPSTPAAVKDKSHCHSSGSDT